MVLNLNTNSFVTFVAWWGIKPVLGNNDEPKTSSSLLRVPSVQKWTSWAISFRLNSSKKEQNSGSK
jgi:hypothetical protein